MSEYPFFVLFGIASSLIFGISIIFNVFNDLRSK